jgi:hypothetical protein
MDFIKIDVQGFELSVLRGAARVLKTNADIVVLLEFWPHGSPRCGRYIDGACRLPVERMRLATL